jgi:hypothetical protein
MSHSGPWATCNFEIARFLRLKKISKMQFLDFPKKHYVLFPDFTIKTDFFSIKIKKICALI